MLLVKLLKIYLIYSYRTVLDTTKKILRSEIKSCVGIVDMEIVSVKQQHTKNKKPHKNQKTDPALASVK